MSACRISMVKELIALGADAGAVELDECGRAV
jgi:hypothetical protein